jgi:uncharacterized protein (TIGR02466 family)
MSSVRVALVRVLALVCVAIPNCAADSTCSDVLDNHGFTPAFRFATPVFSSNVALHNKLNDELLDIFIRSSEHDAGVAKSNKGGGYHSSELFDTSLLRQHLPGRKFDSKVAATLLDLHRVILDGAEAMLRELQDHARQMGAPWQNRTVMEFFVQNTWVNMHTDGGYHTVHNHPNSVLSGVYYVDHGSGNCSSKLEFQDPRPLLQCDDAVKAKELFMLCAWCSPGSISCIMLAFPASC